MAPTSCPNCEETVLGESIACEQCGFTLQDSDKGKRKRSLFFFGGLLAIFGFAIAVFLVFPSEKKRSAVSMERTEAPLENSVIQEKKAGKTATKSPALPHAGALQDWSNRPEQAMAVVQNHLSHRSGVPIGRTIKAMFFLDQIQGDLTSSGRWKAWRTPDRTAPPSRYMVIFQGASHGEKIEILWEVDLGDLTVRAANEAARSVMAY